MNCDLVMETINVNRKPKQLKRRLRVVIDQKQLHATAGRQPLMSVAPLASSICCSDVARAVVAFFHVCHLPPLRSPFFLTVPRFPPLCASLPSFSPRSFLSVEKFLRISFNCKYFHRFLYSQPPPQSSPESTDRLKKPPPPPISAQMPRIISPRACL